MTGVQTCALPISLEFVSSIGFSKVHIFRYSKRRGTPAEIMENQVPESIKEERKKRLNEVAEDAARKFHSILVGKRISVLVESKSGQYFIGHTSSYVKVFVVGTENLVGRLIDVEINSASSEGVYGQLGRILR